MPDKTQNTHSAHGQRRTFVLIVSMFVSVQVVILALAFGALTLTNLIRAYTMSEGLYAKAQKQAIYALQRYAYSGNPADFADYRDKIRVPLGDALARNALERKPPDLETARRGLLRGRNHPDDVSGMIDVFLLFQDTPLLNPALELWRRADELVHALTEQAESLQTVVQSATPDDQHRRRILADIEDLDREITILQDRFSQVMGANTRILRNAAFVALGTASVLLWIASLAFGSHLHRRSLAAEIALEEREERLRTLMDSTADGIVSVDINGHIDAANRAAARIMGCDVEDLLGRPIEDLVSADDHDEFTRAVNAALSGDANHFRQTEFTFDGLRATNRVFPMEVTFTRQEGSDEGRFIVTLRDITERQATEARLFQAQKMEAVGQLTGGIAHDFNNLLTVVMGNLEALRADRRQSAAGEEADRLIRSALSAAERGARVTAYLLAFSRRQPLVPKPVDVDSLIAGMRELFRQTVSATIDVSYRLGSRGWQAMVDPVQLEAALLNLVINAQHATPDGGSITIESRQHVVGSGEATGAELQPGEYVMIRIRDTGSGIAPEHREKVFEPFFTTKEVGRGSGLGLSMVHGFVKQSGGHVRLSSELNEGTTIEFYLPRAASPAAGAIAELAGGRSGSHMRVLVVEDDPAVRAVAVNLLQREGYSVTEAVDGSVALHSLESEGPPNLLLSDVVLPSGMDGYALASQVRRRYPAIRVLLMSGYPRDALAGVDGSEFKLLQKPFTHRQLRAAIEETMAGAVQGPGDAVGL